MKPAIVPLRIAANDPTLAHAMMRQATKVEGDAMLRRLKAHMPKGRNLSVPNLSAAVRGAFGQMLAMEYLGRLHGTRANAHWLALVNSVEGDIAPIWLEYKRERLSHAMLRYRFKSHAIARIAQRTTSVASLGAVAPILVRHLWVIIPKLSTLEDERPPGHPITSFRTCTTEGAFLWKWVAPEWVAGTWIDPQTASDESIRRDCAVDPDKGLLRTLD
jgi:hypothetical protein